MSFLAQGLFALALPVLGASLYLLFLALVSRRHPAPAAGTPALRFDLVVPAHDEETGIARTVQSLLAVDWPRELRRVIVVADNCTDATALRAEAAGARVLVRTDPDRRGKGYALEHAFAHSLRDGFADAVVVVDADSVAEPGLLRAFAARLERGERAAQCRSAVLNLDDSWRTRLMAISLALFNGVRSLARENLGLSTGLRGNGMCLAAATLREHPARAFSIVEDLEYGIDLGRAGVRVAYVHEAGLLSAMASSSKAAGTQRRRWELGRKALARQLAVPLLREAVEKKSAILSDLALDLLVPPLSKVALWVSLGLAASAAVSLAAHQWLPALTVFLACATCILAYVARGWAVSGTGARGLSALAYAPFFVLWKVAALAGRHDGREWVRTAREEVAP